MNNHKNLYLFVLLAVTLLVMLMLFVLTSSTEEDRGNLPEEPVLKEPLQKKRSARLYLSPERGAYQVGDEFDVEVYVDTDDNDVVVVSAYVGFDNESFKVVDIDVEESIFDMEVENEFDNEEGLIRITRGNPTPGVKNSEALVAKIFFEAISKTEGEGKVSFLTSSEISDIKSAVLLDDGSGTDVLKDVRDARFVVVSDNEE